MKKQPFIFLLLAIFVLLSGCAPEANENKTEKKVEEAPEATTPRSSSGMMEKDGLKMYAYIDSPPYEDAGLTLPEPTTNRAGETMFKFGVDNYELGAQTPSAADRGLANSGKGQHIHLIVDNGPYSAHYESNFAQKLEPGYHTVLAFLSRSYHESVKNPSAYVLTQLNVGKTEPKEINLEGPHMFYSRPKGTYTGEDTKRIMVDFFLVNTEIGTGGNTVKCEINGTEFIIDTWVPHVVEGLEAGENTIRLELVDAEGNTIESPFNPVERTFTLEP